MRSFTRGVVGLVAIGVIAAWTLGHDENEEAGADPAELIGTFSVQATLAETSFSEAIFRSNRGRESDIASSGTLVEVKSRESGGPITSAVCVVRGDSSKGTQAFLVNGEGIADLGHISADSFLEVTADGFVGQVVAFSKESQHLLVELNEACSLEGHFEDFFGDRAGGGVLVAAIPVAVPALDWQSLRRGCFSGEREVLIARTDDRGGFRFTRMKEGDVYQVRAIGLGVASQAEVVVAKASSPHLVLVGGSLRAIAIELRDKKTNGPVRSHPNLGGQSAGIRERFLASPRALPFFLGDPLLQGAGLPEGLVAERSLRGSRLLLAIVGFRESGPCEGDVSISLPGYEAWSGRLQYRSPVSGIPTRTVYLDPGLRSWGDLVLEFTGADWIETAVENVSTLVLYPASEGSEGARWLELKLTGLKPSLVLEGIPEGEYRVELIMNEGLDSLRAHEASSIRVGRERAIARFDLSSVFAAEFFLSTEDLAGYVGAFEGVLVHYKDGQTRESPFYFPGPPYAFIGLPEGEYSLMVDPPVMFPRPADPASAGAKFTVGPETAGIVHDLEVVF